MMSETRFEKKLRAEGGRITPQRRLIVSILQKQDRHLSAEEIFMLARRQHSRLSLATVYRTLNRLKESGLLRELRLTDDRCRYELKQDEGHQHIVCLGCGKVIEFTCNHYQDVHEKLAKQYNFKITSARVKLLGYCADCQARIQNEN